LVIEGAGTAHPDRGPAGGGDRHTL